MEYTPTTAHKNIVQVSSGLSYAEIAALIGIDEETLVLHYGKEIDSKKRRGRPAGAIKTPMHRLAANTTDLVPKTDAQKLKELKRVLLDSAGPNVVAKAIEIALNDEHPSQAAMIKLCMDRILPVSMFDKDKNQRSAVTINITGLGETTPQVIDAEDITDV
jgi:hypothetical protein